MKIGITSWKYMDLGSSEGLWRVEYNSYDEATTFDDGVMTKEIFHENNLSQHLHKDWVWMMELYAIGLYIWQIVPVLNDKAGKRAAWSTNLNKEVPAQVLRLLSIRRTLRSRLVLPNGVVNFPGVDLQPMTVVTEELNYDTATAEIIKHHGERSAHGPSRRQLGLWLIILQLIPTNPEHYLKAVLILGHLGRHPGSP